LGGIWWIKSSQRGSSDAKGAILLLVLSQTQRDLPLDVTYLDPTVSRISSLALE
jgi:hypothetical protein